MTNLADARPKIEPPQPDQMLRRNEVATHLTAIGFPISKATLESMATRGGGPPHYKWGKYPVYRWREVLAWVEERLGNSRHSTSEAA